LIVDTVMGRRFLIGALVLAPALLLLLVPRFWQWGISTVGLICLATIWPLTALGILLLPPNVVGPAAFYRSGIGVPFSSVVVVIPTVFLFIMGVVNPQVLTYHVVCLSFTDGRVLWDTVVRSARTRSTAGAGSDAAPTPAISGDLAVAHFSDLTIAVDMSGRIRWIRRQSTPGEAYYGAGSSPVIYATSVIVAENTEYFPEANADPSSEQSRATAPALVSLSLASGRMLWRTQLSRGHGSYSTPAITQVGGRDVLVLPGSQLYLLDPRNGAVFQGMSIDAQEMTSSPAIQDQLVVLGGGPNLRSAAAAFELLATPSATRVESRLLWRSDNRFTTIASPIIMGDEALLADTDGTVTLFDAHSGMVTRELDLSGSVYASPIIAGGRLYIWTTRGTAYIIALKPSMRVLESTELAEDVVATPAVVGSSVILRTVSALYRLDSK
jgi:hypothetical protein